MALGTLLASADAASAARHADERFRHLSIVGTIRRVCRALSFGYERYPLDN